MLGETDLDKLLASMSPQLVDGLFVFATVSDGVVPWKKKTGTHTNFMPCLTNFVGQPSDR